MTHKTDKGFQPIYWNLSYRRKLIRTLWLSPLIFLFFLLPEETEFFGLSRNLFVAFLFVLVAVQAYYNYYKWKISERSSINEDSEKNEIGGLS